MSDGNPFADFLRRIRDGDAQAATELVRQYVPARFFSRAGLGQYELDEPQQLLRLLVVMARNKLRSQVRKERRQRRDHRAVEGAVDEAMAVVGDAPSPSRVVIGKELLA